MKIYIIIGLFVSIMAHLMFDINTTVNDLFVRQNDFRRLIVCGQTMQTTSDVSK